MECGHLKTRNSQKKITNSLPRSIGLQVGELIGGSQREDRYDVLHKRIDETGMDPTPYEAYLDIRKYGTVPHSGFGLGFERLLLFATGLENIREVIPFPRWPGNAAC
jgi:asparaginyl-tRNA synthetase